MIALRDVDVASGIGTLGFSPLDGRSPGSVRLNLLTGELLPLIVERPKPSGLGSALVGMLRSPSGRFVLGYAAAPAGLTVKTSKGEEIGAVMESEMPGLSDVRWSPSEEYFAFMADVGEGTGLYVYSLKQRKARLVARNVLRSYAWSDDGRLLVCVRTPTKSSKALPASLRSRYGSMAVLDAVKEFKAALTVGELVGWFSISPSGSRAAYIERVKDEYGDFDSYSLRVADIATGRVRTLVTNRRTPRVAWAGDDAIAVTIYDKYAVPTLSLIDLKSGATVRLVTSEKLARIRPLACIPDRKRVIYAAETTVSGDGPEELLAVEPGKRPVRLFPRNVRTRQ